MASKKRNRDDVSRIDKEYENDSKRKTTTDQYGRKVWDKEHYKKILDEKNTNEEDELILNLLPDLKKDKKALIVPPHERKLLEERKENLLLEKNLGKVQIITNKSTKEQQGGYYCKICDCVLKDSKTYLDHINGKNHNRILGYSMKVKRVSLNDVKEKLKILKEQKDNKKQEKIEKDLYEDIKKKVNDIHEYEKNKAQKRKEKKILNRLEKQKQKEQQTNNTTEDDIMNMQFKELGFPTSFI
ncbi:zinc finger protein, putative [Hepatocystis sp. ex Piliocolobus tephrosceles]|nr:zinc finger protein, putative [Hepatocystis sp. ex Piliocolobus tephrosceles]